MKSQRQELILSILREYGACLSSYITIRLKRQFKCHEKTPLEDIRDLAKEGKVKIRKVTGPSLSLSGMLKAQKVILVELNEKP